MSATEEDPIVELQSSDLPAFCPNPAMPVWNHHPRVFLDVRRPASNVPLLRHRIYAEARES